MYFRSSRLSYEAEIHCKYVLLRRQSMVCSSPPVYCNLSPCSSTFSCFFTLTPNNHRSPLYSPLESILPWKFFREDISISDWIRYAIILMCYWKKFVKGNSNLLVESRKLIGCISRLFFCKTFFVTRKLSILNLLRKERCYIC